MLHHSSYRPRAVFNDDSIDYMTFYRCSTENYFSSWL